MQQHLEEDGFPKKLIFSDEATFHLHRKINRHDLRIWGTENQHAAIEHIRFFRKLNLFDAVSKKMYGPSFFAESTVIGTFYVDVMEEWLIPQIENDIGDFIYHQDGASPHLHHLVHGCFSQHLPQTLD